MIRYEIVKAVHQRRYGKYIEEAQAGMHREPRDDKPSWIGAVVRAVRALPGRVREYRARKTSPAT